MNTSGIKRPALLVRLTNAVGLNTEKEFTDLIVKNSRMLFGENTLLFDLTQTMLGCYMLIDFSNANNHKLYFVVISPAKQNFWELFAKVTRIFTLYNLPDFHEGASAMLYGAVTSHKASEEELNQRIGGKEIQDYFRAILLIRPSILLLSEKEIPELLEITTTYVSNWGRYVKPIRVNKYQSNGQSFCTLSPAFVDIDSKSNGNSKKPGKSDNPRKEKLTEADHLENSSVIIQNVYQIIKIALLKEDEGLEFNPKQYYISLRKKKNLAFFHITKKSISLVVLNPEEDTLKRIQHHTVRALTEKVQKFWNGPSCTIVIDDLDNLEEVINLLKMLIQNQV